MSTFNFTLEHGQTFCDIDIVSKCNRKLSLNSLQLHASGIKSYKDDGRRRKSRKRVNGTSYDDVADMSGQSLSKNDINMIRRSQVWNLCDINI